MACTEWLQVGEWSGDVSVVRRGCTLCVLRDERTVPELSEHHSGHEPERQKQGGGQDAGRNRVRGRPRHKHCARRLTQVPTTWARVISAM